MSQRSLSMAVISLGWTLIAGCTASREGAVRPGEADAREQAWTFETARSQAMLDVANPASVSWALDNAPEIAQRLGSSISTCGRLTEGGRMPNIELLMRFSSKGQVLDALTSEDTPFGKCMSEQLKIVNVGNAPWEGYWWWTSVGGSPEQDGARPPAPLEVSEGSCRPVGEGSDLLPTSIELQEVDPPQRGAVAEDSVASVRFRYSVPTNSQSRYKLAVAFETARQGVATIVTPIDFPFPATCGTSADLTVKVWLGIGESGPSPSPEIRFWFVIFEGDWPTNVTPVTQSKVIEYSRE